MILRIIRCSERFLLSNSSWALSISSKSNLLANSQRTALTDIISWVSPKVMDTSNSIFEEQNKKYSQNTGYGILIDWQILISRSSIFITFRCNPDICSTTSPMVFSQIFWSCRKPIHFIQDLKCESLTIIINFLSPSGFWARTYNLTAIKYDKVLVRAVLKVKIWIHFSFNNLSTSIFQLNRGYPANLYEL